MKNSTNRNPIYYAAQEVWDTYRAHLEGLLSAPICVISECTLNEIAKNALLASAKQLGYGESSITFVTLAGAEDDSKKPLVEEETAIEEKATTQADMDSTETTLSPEQMFEVVEGIDPQVLIATDSASMSVLSHAYEAEFSPKAPARLFGRNAVGFVKFEDMLDEQTKKRVAWEHLKKLGTAPKAH